MKAVLMSIRPNWCKLICSGMKTLEVRKTRPKLEASRCTSTARVKETGGRDFQKLD